MKEKVNFRARVMKYAYQIWLSTKQSWSECMKRAWSLYRFIQRLRRDVVAFCYYKADGSVRSAYGTLSNIYFAESGNRVTKPSYRTVRYFDVEKNEFRCFRVENLIDRY